MFPLSIFSCPKIYKFYLNVKASLIFLLCLIPPESISLFALHHVFFLFAFLELNLWHMEVPRLGGESELGAASLHHSHSTSGIRATCNLHCSSGQCWILNPPSKARDRTHILLDTSQVHTPLSHNGDSLSCFLYLKKCRDLLKSASITSLI